MTSIPDTMFSTIKTLGKYINPLSRKPGLPPGTLPKPDESSLPEPRISLTSYNEYEIEEQRIQDIQEAEPYLKKNKVTWIHMEGIHDPDLIRRTGEMFNLHNLVLEDIMMTDQRPKFEEYNNFIFVVLKMFRYNQDKNSLNTEQMSFILGPHWLLSFQEKHDDVFHPNRERLKNPNGKLRKGDSDYLFYSLLDTIVDHYFLTIDRIGQYMEALEEDLIKEPDYSSQQTIYQLKREIIFMRRSVWPLREVVDKMQKRDIDLISDSTRFYLKDVYDHVVQIIDSIESSRELLTSLLDLYLTSVGNKMNSIMKTLTIISTIFIPLTFIAGVYGMNFKYMPELEWRYGYYMALGLMAAIPIGLLLFFKKKGWF